MKGKKKKEPLKTNTDEDKLQEENLLLKQEIAREETKRRLNQREYRYLQLNQLVLLNENLNKIGQSLNNIGKLMDEEEEEEDKEAEWKPLI